MSFFRPVRVIRTLHETPRWVGRLHWLTTALVGVALLLVIARSGYGLVTTPLLRGAVVGFNFLVLAAFAADVVLGFVTAQSRWQHFKRRWFDVAVLVPIGVAIAAGGTGITFVVLRQLVVVGQAFTRSQRFAGFLEEMRLQPVRLLALSFLAMIALGTLFLTFPAATRDGSVTGIVDALFTATSATCVTGLIVRSTPHYWSGFGQLVILVLFQLGGLGIMTFSASLAVVLGRRLGLGERRTVSDIIGESRNVDIARILRYIISIVLTVELVGTLLLFLRFLPDFPRWTDALWNAAFHSVSGFCNAGFSLFDDSLARYRVDPAVNLVMVALILTGGLGFVVVRELFNRTTLRRGPLFGLRRLSVHARLVLATSFVLVVTGTVVFFFTEYDRALASLPTAGKLLAALFQSVTARTAGFNTVSFEALHPVTLFLWAMLMFVGASPGGTGGGIKTTTFAILLLSVRNRVLGREDITVGQRVVPRDVIYRATSIVAVAGGLVALAFALLLLTERQPFENLLFETFSAFGTVGLSTGLTAELSAAGKVVITALMYVGRIGPLTLALAMRTRRAQVAIGFPEARVLVG
ncbi:MAG: TrkH family potassium uptake protein [bacterium]